MKPKNPRAEAGFTLVELLVALALTALIAGFVLGGFDLSRRTWAMSRDRDGGSETDAAARQLRALLSRTMPVTAIDPRERIARLHFEGRSDSISFVTLSEATSFTGGLMRVRLSWQNRRSSGEKNANVILQSAVFRANPELSTEVEPVILFRDVTSFSLTYFGAPEIGKPPQWQAEWIDRGWMPLLVLARIDLAGNNGPRHLSLPVRLRLASPN